MKNHTVTVTITTGTDDEGSPSSKAAHVADIVRAYASVVDDGEPLDTVVIDLIADLLHFADTVPVDQLDWDPVSYAVGLYVAERAVAHYTAERYDA